MVDLLLLGAIVCALVPSLRPASPLFVLLLIIFYPAVVLTITVIFLVLAAVSRSSR